MNGYENKKSNENLYNLDIMQEKDLANEISGGKLIEGGEVARVDHGVWMIGNVRMHGRS